MPSRFPNTLAAGDSYSAIVETHWPAVYRLLYTLTGNRHDSEELAQETFLRGWKRWHAYEDGTVRGWLLRIATNTFYDRKRKERNRRSFTLVHDWQCDAHGPEHEMTTREEAERIRSMVRMLPATTRMVFHLRVTEELPFREIAKLAGVSEEAARWHMHQARARLLKRLRPACAE